MKYLIIEIQKSNEGPVAITPVEILETRDAAEHRFHTILASAAISQVNVHSVVMLDDNGDTVRKESYYH